MVQTDPLADMLTIIRNGLMRSKESVICPYSKTKEGILAVLKEEGYIDNYKFFDEDAVQKKMKIYLKYGPRGERVIQRIERISKPGRRFYSKIGDLKPVLNGLGIDVISTSQGVLSDRQAREKNIGGEVLCRIW